MYLIGGIVFLLFVTVAGNGNAPGWTAFVRHGSGGAEAVKDLTTKFPAGAADDSLESVGEAIQKTYDEVLISAPDPRGIERLDNALDSARGVLNPHLRDFVAPHIGPNGAFKSMEEFEALRFIKAENLRPDQVNAMIAIRNAIPNPVSGTPMQKVIKGTDIDAFIDANSDISGFVAKKGDAGTEVFSNSEDMIEGLRLDYQDGFQGQSSIGVIEWNFNANVVGVDIPRSSGFGGSVDRAYPYVGNGFSATKSGRLVPEYVLTGAVPPPNGAKLFELRQDGSKILRAEFIDGVWVRP
jgi:hypothetical protein